MGVQEKITEIIVEQLGVKPEEVVPEASFVDDLGADSLDTVELVMAFEEEFGAEIPDEDAEKIQTVGDAVKYIEEKNKSEVVARFSDLETISPKVNNLYASCRRYGCSLGYTPG